MGLMVIGVLAGLLSRRGPKHAPVISAPAVLPAPPKPAVSAVEQQFEAKLAEHEALEREAEVKALSALKLVPVITKTAEVMAKHIRENVKEKPEISTQALRSWIREEG